MRFLETSQIRRVWAALAKPYRHAALGGLATLALLLPLWYLGGQWYEGRLLADQRVLVSGELTPFKKALAAAITRPMLLYRGIGLVVVGVLTGLVGWTLYRTARLQETLGKRTRELERDIAEREQMEEALWASRTHFSSIVELSEDAIISIDESQRIRLFNRGAETTFGYRAEEVLGNSLGLLLPVRFSQVHREHVRRFTASADIQRPMNQRQTVYGRRKDGSEFPAEASISKFEMRGERIMSVRLRDITTRQRAEEALARLAAIVESSEDAIMSKTLDGIILTWNAGAERLYGYTAAEARGRSITFLMPDDRVEELPKILDRVRRGESMRQYETVRVQKDGRRIDVSLSISPIKDTSGSIVGASIIARDITERKRLEAQMRQAQKMEAIGTLAGGIAHDFNNLLAAMLGHTELALDEMPRDSQAWQDLQEALAAGQRAKDLVKRILTFSRKGEQERRPIPLHEVVRDGMKLLRASLPSTIEIRQHIDARSGLVLADATQMHQVLMNLCVNAEHAMRPRGGLLEVRLDAVAVDAEFAMNHPPLAPGPHVRLTVRDTGHGMTAEVKERIFDPFFTTKPQSEGTGMGLAVVHGIVASHGGIVAAESAPGRGSRFDIYLPASDAAAPVATPREDLLPGGKERILVVDDEPFLAYLWGQMLERIGYRVTQFTSSPEALEALRAAPESFDLLITDQTMPHMTGEEMARQVLRLRPDLPIVLCTGFSHTLTEEKARALGIRAYLTKPIDRRELSLTVQRLLGQRIAQEG
jgi:PAS domain S-box-containing protein